jgi:hypothetical protein
MRVLAPGESGSPADNTLDADVVDVVYLGAHRRVELRFRDGSSGAVREPAGKESAAARGDAVRVTWSQKHSVLVPEHQ